MSARNGRSMTWACALATTTAAVVAATSPATAVAQASDTSGDAGAPAVPAAALPVPAAIPPPEASDLAAQESAVEIDLANGAIDQNSTADKALSLYGFSDFTYFKAFGRFGQPGTFYVGNLNAYLAADLGAHWRSLLEVRYLYLPNGAIPGATSVSSPPATAQGRTDTTVSDYSLDGLPVQWAGISIQRA